MWNSIRSFVIWLHEPSHVARFQHYFGILPLTNNKPDLIPKIDENTNNHIDNGKSKQLNSVHHRHHERKITYDTNVLDECIEEIKHSTNKKNTSLEIDYKITLWFWYYFFQFGSALGNEIFYIVFFPTW
jgi:hypothetical protein